MTDRIQRALDGELPIDQLDPHEAAEVQRYQAAASQALRRLDSLPEIDVAAAVLRRIDALETAPAATAASRSALVRAGRWLWSPRPVALTLRPALGLAAAAALAAVVLVGTVRTAPAPSPSLAVVEQAPAQVLVQFRFGDSNAREVALIGDFNSWQPEHRLHEISPGVWSVVIALEPGVYDYGFVVDGDSWRLDPLAPQVADGFGGANSRVAVLSSERKL